MPPTASGYTTATALQGTTGGASTRVTTAPHGMPMTPASPAPPPPRRSTHPAWRGARRPRSHRRAWSHLRPARRRHRWRGARHRPAALGSLAASPTRRPPASTAAPPSTTGAAPSSRGRRRLVCSATVREGIRRGRLIVDDGDLSPAHVFVSLQAVSIAGALPLPVPAALAIPLAPEPARGFPVHDDLAGARTPAPRWA